MTSIAEHDVATDRLARRSRSFVTWFGWEGISLSVAGAALLARALFDYNAGEPPALGTELGLSAKLLGCSSWFGWFEGLAAEGVVPFAVEGVSGEG